MKEIKCKSCNGHYVVRSGKFGEFAGCSNYPKCKSTLKIRDLVLEYIKTYGINIYAWDKICWKCGKSTKVYSYYLNYDLGQIDVYFKQISSIGVGDISTLDKLLSLKYPTICVKFSKTENRSYWANTCQHCKTIQGRFYVVEDPHEIMDELFDNGMDKYFIENIPYEKAKVFLNELMSFF